MTDTGTPSDSYRRTSTSVRFIEHFLEHKGSGKLTGLLIGKLDALNRISTTFGQERAERFCAQYIDNLRDALTAGTPIIRLSDRRFAVVLALDSMSAIMDIAARIAEDEYAEIREGDDTFLVDVTVGVAVYPAHADDAESLFRRAELALRQAHDSQVTFEIYQPDATGKQAALWKFESELEKAVAHGSIEVYYQPKLGIKDNRVTGVEALVRWRHDSGRLIGPEQFIPLAERTGSVVPITWVVFESVAGMAETWKKLDKPFSVAVNISPQVLGDREFFDRVRTLKEWLSACGVDVTLELTEDSLLEGDSETIAKFTELKALGIEIAIDDFGKGHSALTYLKRLPADEIKIDKHFIGTLATDEKDRHIVEAVVNLAHAFGMRVVAEGVDNEESLRMICELDCETAQGFFFSRPIRGDLLYEWVSSYSGAAISKLIGPAGLQLTAS